MESFTTLIATPILVAVLVLIIEYWVIQPLRQRLEKLNATKNRVMDISNETPTRDALDINQEKATTEQKHKPKAISLPQVVKLASDDLPKKPDFKTSTTVHLQYILKASAFAPIVFSPDGALLTFEGVEKWQRRYLIWQPISENQQTPGIGVKINRNKGYYYNTEGLFYSRDGQHLAQSISCCVNFWHIDNKEMYQQIETSHNGDMIFSLDGAILVTRDAESIIWKSYSIVEIWRVEDSGRLFHEQFTPIKKMIMNSRGDQVVILRKHANQSDTFVIETIDINHFKIEKKIEIKTRSIEKRCAFSPDGSTFSYCSEKHLHVYQISDSRLLYTIPEMEKVSALSYSPDGFNLISGHYGGEIRLFDLKTGKLIRTFRGHAGTIVNATMSKDGTLIASQCGNGVIRYWRVDNGSPICALKGFYEEVTFSPTANVFFSATKKKLFIGHVFDLTFVPYYQSVKVWKITF